MRNSIKGHLAMLTANSIWGLTTPMAKAVLLFESVTFLSLTSYRLLGAAVVFWIASLFTKKEKVSSHDLVLLFFASLFSIVFNQGFFMKGLSVTSPIDATIIATTTPIFTMIISAIYLKEEVTWVKIVGILLGAGGALLLILAGKSNAASAGNGLGNLLCMLAQLSFSIYLVMFKGLIDRFSPVTLMKWIFTFASLCFLPISIQSMEAVHYDALTPQILLYTAAIIFGGTFLSYLFVSVGQHSLKPSVVSMYNYVQPVVASVIAVLWGMDSFGLTKTIAVILVFTGVFLVSKGKFQKER